MLWCLLQPAGYTESGELGGAVGEVHVTCAHIKRVGSRGGATLPQNAQSGRGLPATLVLVIHCRKIFSSHRTVG